tara:strand:+ start:5363 stop:6859 length:1497 start_codon:yes stop_codon:yes gene_type:complete
MSNNSSSFNPMKPFLVFVAILTVLWLMIGGIELTGILPGTSKNLVKRRKISDVKKLLKKLYDSESGDDPIVCSEIRDWWDDNQEDYEEANEDELPDEIYVWKNFWPSKMDTDEFLDDYMENYGGSDYETKFLKLAEGTAKCEDEIKGTTSDLNKLKTIYTKMNVTSYQPDAAGVDCADLKAVKDLILPNFVWSYEDDGFIDSKEYRNEFIGKKSGDKDPTNLYNTTCLNQVSFDFKTYNAKVPASGTGTSATQARSANVHINNIQYGDPFFKLEIKDTNTGRVLGKHTFSSGDNKPTTGTTDPGVFINLDDPYASDTTTGFKPIVYEMFVNGVSVTPYFSNFGMQFDDIEYKHEMADSANPTKSDHKFVLTNYTKSTNTDLKFWVCGTGVGTGTGTTGSADIGLRMNADAGTPVNGAVDANNNLVTDFAADGAVPAGATYTLYVYDSTKLTSGKFFECHKPASYITDSTTDIALTQGAYKIGTFKIPLDSTSTASGSS